MVGISYEELMMKPIGCVYCWADTQTSDRPIPVFHAEYIYEGNGTCEKHLKVLWNSRSEQDRRQDERTS